MKKLSTAILTSTIMATAFLAPVESQAQSPDAVINQGDRIVIGSSVCTAGYIDKATNTMITASHCTRTGTDVYKIDSLDQWHKVGVVETNPDHNSDTARNDFAFVKLDKNVAGENIYSGDTRITPDDVVVGDQFCSIGTNSPVIKCGVVKNIDGNVVVTNREGGGVKGDSGGPGWIPGKGFFGVYTLFWGANEYPSENRRNNGAAFTYPEYSDADVKVKLNTGNISFPAPELVSPDKAKPVTPTPTPTPTPAPAPNPNPAPTPAPNPNPAPKPTNNTSSSTISPVAIVLGLLGIASVGAVVFNIYRAAQSIDINRFI